MCVEMCRESADHAGSRPGINCWEPSILPLLSHPLLPGLPQLPSEQTQNSPVNYKCFHWLSGNLFREAVSCWGSTTSWSMFAFIIHAQCDRHRHGHKWSSRSGLDKCFWTCNAAQHAFCPAIPKHEISMVHVEAFEHIMGMHCNALVVLLELGMLMMELLQCQNGLTRSWLVLLATCSSLSAKELNLVWIWRPPTTDRWTTVTLLLSHARPLQRPSALCQAWRFLLRASSLHPLANTEKYSWTSEALVPEFVILIQETFILFCCWTGMNIRTINDMHVSYLQVAMPGNIRISHSAFTNCSNMF